MTERREITPIQEPGIGGPVDLAGIERYGRIRSLRGCCFVVAMFATSWRLPERAGPAGGILPARRSIR